jgi:hypothetical protein
VPAAGELLLMLDAVGPEEVKGVFQSFFAP